MRSSSELKRFGFKASFPRKKILERFDKAEGIPLTADDCSIPSGSIPRFTVSFPNFVVFAVSFVVYSMPFSKTAR
jgi:hypothetical protein